MLAVASVLLAFIFICYFVEPLDLWRRLAELDIHTAAGISGAAVTLVAFLDFVLVRQRFCTTVCPYGYPQGLLGDLNTLLVHYRDETHECIDCKKCVRACPMDIDIRQSPFQIECIHCAACIDACQEIMAHSWKPEGALLPAVCAARAHRGTRSSTPADAERKDRKRLPHHSPRA